MSHLANETELVSAARSGNQEAFGMLMGAYYQPVFRVALGMLHQREDAEDVLQQAMLKAYCNLDRFQDIELLHLDVPHYHQRSPNEDSRPSW